MALSEEAGPIDRARHHHSSVSSFGTMKHPSQAPGSRIKTSRSRESLSRFFGNSSSPRSHPVAPLSRSIILSRAEQANNARATIKHFSAPGHPRRDARIISRRPTFGPSRSTSLVSLCVVCVCLCVSSVYVQDCDLVIVRARGPDAGHTPRRRVINSLLCTCTARVTSV